ncbi:MAG TPA: hypothetical protein VGE02_06740 [Gemmatimonadales bacterium]
MRRPFLLLLALAVVACTPGARGEGAAPGPRPQPRDTTEGPEAPGGRWYGYEGGLADAEAAARSIAGAGQYWTRTEGEWRGADTTGSYVAFHDGRWLRRLEIEMGTTKGAYTYDEKGRLFHYSGERTRRTGRGRQARTEKTVVSVALDGRGTVSAASRTVNGRRDSLTQDEVARIVEIEKVARAAVH